jgi:starvation-inducible DNA-binding protein
MEGMTMAEHLANPAEAAPTRQSQPWLHQHGKEIQAFGTVRQFPLALAYETRMYSCQRLNQILADTQILYALYNTSSHESLCILLQGI